MGRWLPGLQRFEGDTVVPVGEWRQRVWTSSETGCSEFGEERGLGVFLRVWNVIRGGGGRKVGGGQGGARK